MCGGVLSGFAGVKLSGSPRASGKNKANIMRVASSNRAPRKSLTV